LWPQYWDLTNLGDLQRDLMGVKSHPTKIKFWLHIYNKSWLWGNLICRSYFYATFIIADYFRVYKMRNISYCQIRSRAIAQAVSRRLPTAAVRGSKPDLDMWDLWWDKVALGRFSRVLRFPLQSSFAPAITPQSPSYIIQGKMYNRPMCGRSTGTYTNLGDLQRDLSGLSPTPPNKKNYTAK
jgi:hypothetical protein